MLCYVCLIDELPDPAESVTSVDGTLVCLEHLKSVANSSVLVVKR